MTGTGQQTTPGHGLSPQEVRRFLYEQFRRWADYEDEKPIGWLPEVWESHIDPRILMRAVNAIDQIGADDDSRSAARKCLDPILARGLERRCGTFVVAPMIVRGWMLNDWVAWQTTYRWYEEAGGHVADIPCERWDLPCHLMVCESCTVVFRPVRRAGQARRCPLCSRRPAEPALGSPETTHALATGAPVTVRVPVTKGNRVVSWTTKTVMRCPECGEVAFTRRGALTCGSTRCQSCRRRRLT